MTETETAQTHRQSAPAPEAWSGASEPVFRDILCAVAGTRASTAAVRLAASLAGQGGHLTLLAVTAESGSGDYASAAISPSRVKRVLEHAERIAEEAGVASTTAVDPAGPPVKVILERATAHDLLAIGAPATSWLAGMLVGGVAAAALSQFTTPMLVVRPSSGASLRGRRILVASDGQEGSDRVVELAGRLGLSQGASVTLLHALGRESAARPHRIQSQAKTLKLILGDACEALVEPGAATDVLLEVAKRSKAAMVVMGSRRLGGLRAIGSVSRRAVHEAPCSVLLLPPE
ncbi:MAG: universal stress protein [Solirubrobacteraceae bacterium]|jgi:nucleotide-binding universal stress UspA family protein